MTDDTSFETVARRAGLRLDALKPGVSGRVDQALTDDPLMRPGERVFDPISLAAAIVSLAELGWTIYHDIKTDRAAAAAADRQGRTQMLAAQIAKESVGSVLLPIGLTAEQHALVFDVVAEETVSVADR